MNRKTLILLTIIILIASALRLWQLGNIPPSPDWDEVALGYDGYSIIHTARDEYGKFLPVVLRSFDDYKPALYAYLTIPLIQLFDLTVFAVRLPSAIFGILTVLATYFLIKELFKKDSIALLCSGLLAISPWHIQFSRVAFESNAGVAFNVFAALFFIKSLNKKPIFLLLSLFFAALNLYVYQSEKVFTPLLMLVLILIYRKDLFKFPKKYLIFAVLVGFIVVFPMIFNIIIDNKSLLRMKGTSVFSEQTVLLQDTTQRLIEDQKNNDKLGLILDNRRIVYFKTIADGYISHFYLNWLFITGDIPRHHAPFVGLIYFIFFPFLFIGIYGLIFNSLPFNIDKNTKLLIFSWFLIAPIPASITTGLPHAVRTLNFLPTYQVFIAIGILTAYFYINNRFKAANKINYTIKTVSYLAFIFLFVLNFSYYLDQYFVQQNYYSSQEWQYGYQQMISEVKNIESNYKKVVVSDKSPLDKSYMFFLFYLKYPPAEYQKVGQYESGGFAEHHYFDKYEFRIIDWNKDSKNKNILYIGSPSDFPSGISTIKTIYNLNGSAAIKMVGT